MQGRLRWGILAVSACVVAAVLAGSAPAGFAPPTKYAFSSDFNTYADMTLGDVNGDGTQDAITGGIHPVTCQGGGSGCFTGSVAVQLGDGFGFDSPETHRYDLPTGSPLNGQVTDVALGDLNEDGAADIVASTDIGPVGFGVWVFLGNKTGGVPDGTFAPPVAYVAGPAAQGVAVGDVNGDGHKDVIVACRQSFTDDQNNFHPRGIAVLLGDGSGTLGQSHVYTLASDETVWAVGATDLNGDGRDDVVAASYDLFNLQNPGHIQVYLGQQNGSLGPPTPYQTPAGTESVTFADLNGDTKTDVVTANWASDNVSVLLGNGNGTFGAATNLALPQFAGPSGVAVADVNDDTTLDLVVADRGNSSVSQLLGNGDGTFGAPTVFQTGVFGGGIQPSDVFVATVDGDAIPDAVISDVFNGTAVLAGDFTPPETAIDAHPDATTDATDATFTYHAPAEPNSEVSFECKLDGADFTPCSDDGIFYSNLAPGQHTFDVRATDYAGNQDATPAEYGWLIISPPSGHSLSGHVWAAVPGAPLQNAYVEACPTPDDVVCKTTFTDGSGAYSFPNLPDHTSGNGAVDHSWTLNVNPPTAAYLSATFGPVAVNGVDVPDQDVTLSGPAPFSAGTSIQTNTFGTQNSGNPTVYWHDTITLFHEDCPHSAGTATLHVNDGYEQTVAVQEVSVGLYKAVFDAPFPHHGAFSIHWTIQCPAATSTGGFDGYIDPSGVVKTVGGDPVAGATVTLFRSDTPGGTYTQVPDGSAIMSPANRANPDTTDATGHFGWDVLAGYYKVRASKGGCTAVGGSPAYAETGVLTIPPPVTDLALTLDCTADVTAPTVTVPADKSVEATSAAGAAVSYIGEVSASDVDDAAGAPNCAPSSGSIFPFGLTVVTCASTDTKGNQGSAQFNVVVDDSTAPSLTVPPTQNADATSPNGAAVTFSPAPSASDTVDGPVTVDCMPASGATFPNGDTTVHCHATDAHLNTANGQFTVHVRGPVEQATALKALLNGFSDVAAGLRKSLGKKLDTVVKDLNKGPKGTKAACGQVRSFSKTVAKAIPKKIPPGEGNQLLAGAASIKNAIGCA
jgi:hypothetical protein